MYTSKLRFIDSAGDIVYLEEKGNGTGTANLRIDDSGRSPRVQFTTVGAGYVQAKRELLELCRPDSILPLPTDPYGEPLK